MPLYFGMFVSVAAYLVGMALKKKLGWAILNPLLVAILLVMALLKATGISYGDYNQGGVLHQLFSDTGHGLSGDPPL